MLFILGNRKKFNKILSKLIKKVFVLSKTKKKYKINRPPGKKDQVKEIIKRLDKLRDEISETWDDVTVEEELNEQRKEK